MDYYENNKGWGSNKKHVGETVVMFDAPMGRMKDGGNEPFWVVFWDEWLDGEGMRFDNRGCMSWESTPMIGTSLITNDTYGIVEYLW